jgi:hypothetical protein
MYGYQIKDTTHQKTWHSKHSENKRTGKKGSQNPGKHWTVLCINTTPLGIRLL